MDRMKPKWQFWFWRIYASSVWLLFATTAVLWLSTYKAEYWQANFYTFPLYLPVVLAICSLYIFPWQYSVFGKYRRRRLPKAAPLRTIGESWESFRSWGGAGRSNMGPIVWLLYRDGIGIKTVYGKVFIPLEDIDGLDLLHGFDNYRHRDSTATLFHHSPEIREPITVPDWIAEIIAAHYPDKVLHEAQAE